MKKYKKMLAESLIYFIRNNSYKLTDKLPKKLGNKIDTKFFTLRLKLIDFAYGKQDGTSWLSGEKIQDAPYYFWSFDDFIKKKKNKNYDKPVYGPSK